MITLVRLVALHSWIFTSWIHLLRYNLSNRLEWGAQILRVHYTTSRSWSPCVCVSCSSWQVLRPSWFIWSLSLRKLQFQWWVTSSNYQISVQIIWHRNVSKDLCVYEFAIRTSHSCYIFPPILFFFYLGTQVWCSHSGTF